jgi:hypothetical protein
VIDLYALTDAVFERLKSDAEGAAVRTALGDGATSVLLVEDLRLEAQLGAQQHPARPMLALRRGAAPTVDRVINRPTYTWFLYDDIPVGYGRIEALIPLVAAAYAEGLLSVPTVGVDDITVSALAQTRDDRLKYLLCPISVVIGAI